MDYDFRGHLWSLGVYLAAFITGLPFLIESRNVFAADVNISRFQAAAESGSVSNATFNLGLLFFDKNDHPRDFPKAARLLRQAASAGYVPAMYSLALFLTKHPTLARSPDEARISLETATSNGSWKSSVVLGILARGGNGVAQGPAGAYDHFQVAILQCDENQKQFPALEQRGR